MSAFDKLKYLAEGKEEFIDSHSLYEDNHERQHTNTSALSSSSSSIFSRAFEYPFSLVVIVLCIVLGACLFYFFYNKGQRIHHQPQTHRPSLVKEAMTSIHDDYDDVEHIRPPARYDGDDARSAAATFTRHKQVPEYEQIPSADDSEPPLPKNQRVTWADEATGQPLEQIREIPSIRIGSEQAW